MKKIPFEHIYIIPVSKVGIHSMSQNLMQITKLSEGCYQILLNFFAVHHNNSYTREEAESILEIEKEDVEEEFDIVIPSSLFKEVVDNICGLSNEFIQNDEYKKIISEYQEEIVSIYLNNKMPKSMVHHEPTIRYKQNKLFKRKKFRNSKCDIVIIEPDRREFYGYECKITMKAFYKSLNQPLSSHRSNNKKIRKNKRKQNYMASLITFLNNRTTATKVDVCYITMFNTYDFIASIGNVPVYSLRDIPYNEII